jgi:Flp pilus assembly protein TadB
MLTWAILAGGLCGLGVALIVAGLIPVRPDLAESLARLQAHPLQATGQRPDQIAPQRRDGLIGLAGGRLQRLAEQTGLRIPTRELDLVGQTPESFLLTKAGFAGAGLVGPSVLSALWVLLGVAVPFVIPVGAGLILAAIAFFIPDRELRVKSAAARREFRRAICTYIDLVALERLADAGAVEAVERAADVGAGWVFDRIRGALAHAQLAGISPWQALSDLAEEVGVTELGDVGEIVSLSSEDGAAVYETLRARARAVRTAILADHETQANEASEKLAAPVACLGLVFIGLLVYPAVMRLLVP